MTAVTAQQAALRILLEDVEPLLRRAEASAAQLQNAHESMEADLVTLAALVQRSIEAPAALLEAGRRLDSAAARIEAASTACAPARQAGALWSTRPRRWYSAVGAALLCLAGAAGGAAGAMALAREDAAQAHLGRALQRGWPSLDPATRTKVEAALRR